MTALESRIGALEEFLSELKAASNGEREVMIDSIDFGNHLAPQTNMPRERSHETYLPVGYDGPASLSNSSLLAIPKQQIPAFPVSLLDTASGIEFSTETITRCVASFFRWHHPYHSVIDKELFLLAYLDSSSPKSYLFLALEYAICALGALSSLNTRHLADRFSTAATRNHEMGGLYDPNDLSIQALLLSSYYQIGKGDFSKAWILSGIGFRMAEDLMYNDEKAKLNQGTPRDIKIDSRRRMFMTCYESDKFSLRHLKWRLVI